MVPFGRIEAFCIMRKKGGDAGLEVGVPCQCKGVFGERKQVSGSRPSAILIYFLIPALE